MTAGPVWLPVSDTVPHTRHRSARAVALGLLAAAIIARLAGTAQAEVGYAALAVYALFGRAEAIQALGLSWLFTMLSPGVAPASAGIAVGRYLVMSGAAGSVLLRTALARKLYGISTPVLSTLLLGTWLVVHSALFSFLPLVSILKAVSWTVTTATLLAAWGGLSERAHERLEKQVFGGLAVILGASLAVVPAGLGYLRNGTGLQGILNHPQAFGVTMALLAAWLVGSLFEQQESPWWRLPLIGTCALLVVLSETRTAGLALAGGVPLAILAASASTRASVWARIGWRRTALLAFLGVTLFAAGATVFRSRLTAFVQKRADAATVLSAYEISRGAFIQVMWRNVKERPLQGIGFGVPSEPMSLVVDRGWMGIPTSASVEKGVVPLAILEELGVPGLLVVGAWLLLLVRRAGRAGLAASAVLWVALLTNMGEATLFSPGGMGLLLLILVGWATTATRNARQECGASE